MPLGGDQGSRRVGRRLLRRIEWIARLLNWEPFLATTRAAFLLLVACRRLYAPLSKPGGMLYHALCARFVSQDTPHARFMENFWRLVPRARWFDTLWRASSQPGEARAALRLEAIARVSVVAMFRSWMLEKVQARHGVPATRLMEAIVAVYPTCDLACVGCYTQEERLPARAPRPRLAPLVDEAASCGAMTIHLIGKGEPFLDEEQASELCRVVAARPHLIFVVATNGQRIDERLARRLGRLSNLFLFISIDGPREVHDARRGKGTYDKILGALERLRRHGALFGFSATVSRWSSAAVTSLDFVRELADAGCFAGMYSRYFPLSPALSGELTMRPGDVEAYVSALARANAEGPIPLLDLDQLEGGGCRSRAGLLVYIDGLTGQVSPCIRTPFSPPECKLDLARGRGLPEILGHAFFARYRAGADGRPSGCSSVLADELTKLGGELVRFGPSPPALAAYRDRARVAARPPTQEEARVREPLATAR
jgi:hypothetical protein